MPIPPVLVAALVAIDDKAWTAIPYFLDGADVAQATYRGFDPPHHQPHQRGLVAEGAVGERDGVRRGNRRSVVSCQANVSGFVY